MTKAFPIRPVVLVVDPDLASTTAIAAALDRKGYDCYCAGDAAAARKTASSLPLDLIICDVNVRGESGLALCQELRQATGQEAVPLLFVSATQQPDVVRRMHDEGGIYYVRKPYDPHLLVELASEALWMPHLVRNALGHKHRVPAPLAAHHWQHEREPHRVK